MTYFCDSADAERSERSAAASHKEIWSDGSRLSPPSRFLGSPYSAPPTNLRHQSCTCMLHAPISTSPLPSPALHLRWPPHRRHRRRRHRSSPRQRPRHRHSRPNRTPRRANARLAACFTATATSSRARASARSRTTVQRATCRACPPVSWPTVSRSISPFWSPSKRGSGFATWPTTGATCAGFSLRSAGWARCRARV